MNGSNPPTENSSKNSNAEEDLKRKKKKIDNVN